MTCRVQEYDVCFFGYFQSDFEKRPVHDAKQRAHALEEEEEEEKRRNNQRR